MSGRKSFAKIVDEIGLPAGRYAGKLSKSEVTLDHGLIFRLDRSFGIKDVGCLVEIDGQGNGWIVDRLAERLAEPGEEDRFKRMIGCVIRNCRNIDDSIERDEPGPMTGPVWAKVAFVCGIGSTSAIALCKEFGVDPHEERKEEE